MLGATVSSRKDPVSLDMQHQGCAAHDSQQVNDPLLLVVTLFQYIVQYCSQEHDTVHS